MKRGNKENCAPVRNMECSVHTICSGPYNIHIINTITVNPQNSQQNNFFLIFSYSFILSYTENAATKIQAVFRGHKVRASMKQGDSLAASETADAAQANAGSDPSKEELEAEFREDDKGMQFRFNSFKAVNYLWEKFVVVCVGQIQTICLI